MDFPDRDIILELPDSELIRQLKDALLHWWDLTEAKQYLGAYSSDNNDIVNKALVQSAIVSYYKCFGNSKFRHYPLMRDKVLAGYPPEAKGVFDYYHTLRNKFIVHDESRNAQVITAAILDPEQEFPLVETLATVVNTEYSRGSNLDGLNSLLHLVLVTIEWVEKKIDTLCDAIKEEHKNMKMQDYQGFKPPVLTIPTNDNMFEKRY